MFGTKVRMLLLVFLLTGCKTYINVEDKIPLVCRVAEWCGNTLKDTTACGTSISACTRYSITLDCHGDKECILNNR